MFLAAGKMNSCFLLLFFLHLNAVFLASSDEFFQYYGTFYRRNTYDNATFDELFEDFSRDAELTTQDYRYIINRGLAQYFMLCDRVKKIKLLRTDGFMMKDQLDFEGSNSGKNFTFKSAVGLSNMNAYIPDLIEGENQMYYEVRSQVFLPSITLKGFLELENSKKSLDNVLQDILYSSWQRKRISENYDIKITRTVEKFHINSTKLKIEGGLPEDSSQYERLYTEVAKDSSKYLTKVAEYIKAATGINSTLTADTQFLLTSKDRLIEKLSIVVSKTVTSFGTVSSNIPRFSFYDEDSSMNYDLISGVLEVDAEKTNLSIAQLSNGDFSFTTPLMESTLTFFVTEQNCTDMCHTFGDRSMLKNLSALLTFTGKKIEKITLQFELESGRSTNDQHYLRKPTGSIIESMMMKISKILSEMLLARMKVFFR